MALYRQDDPLARVKPRTGIVQNTGSQVPNTAPIASRPPAAQGPRTATPGPAATFQPMLPQAQAGSQLAPAVAPAPGVAPLAPAVTPGGASKVGVSAPPASPTAPPPAPDLYGKGGGGGLEDQIRGALSGMFSGSTSKGFIDRARSALGSATEAQRAQSVRRIDDDAIKRGLFQSGIPAESAAAAGTAAQGSFAAGLADILNNAEQQDIQGRQFATGAATNLLGMNRDWDRYSQERADAMAARGGGGGGGEDEMTTIIDPDTGQSYEIPVSYLDF